MIFWIFLIDFTISEYKNLNALFFTGRDVDFQFAINRNIRS